MLCHDSVLGVKMKVAGIYVWRGKAYVPMKAQFESGIFVGTEPVTTAELSAEELLTAVGTVLSAGHPRLPAPSWKELAKTGAAYTIDWTDKEIRVDMSRLNKKGRWEYDPEKTCTFPPDTPLDQIIAIIMEDIRSRPTVWQQ